MKKALLTLLLAIGFCTVQGQVRFETKSTDAIHEMALKAGKLVFIDLYAPWCPPCRMMDKHVFSRKDVGDFMEKYFVSAKYDTDKPTGKALMQKYGGNAIPTYLIFNTNGELLGRIQGASAAEEFMADVETILSRQKKE